MTAALLLQPVVNQLLGTDSPVAVRFWDGSTIGGDQPTTINVRSPEAVRHLLWAPGELGLARAYVSGDLELEGDIYDLLAVRDSIAGARDDADMSMSWRERAGLLPIALRLKLLGR